MDFTNLLEIFINTAHAATETAGEAEKASGIGTLGLNWKLFAAQLFNFAIIVGVLYKWVFTPVGKKLQERHEKVNRALKDAEDIENQKTEFETWKQQAIMEARKQAAEIVAGAQKEAGTVKDSILAQTKQDQAKILSQAKAQIATEQKNALEQAKAEVADLVTTAAEKVIRTKLDDKEDKELINQAMKEAGEDA